MANIITPTIMPPRFSQHDKSVQQNSCSHFAPLLHFRGARLLLLAALFLGIALNAAAQRQEQYRIAFWNVENLFDPQNDSLTNDEEYTPLGLRHWTYFRYSQKLNNLYKTIVALGDTVEMNNISGASSFETLPPILIGLAEVENDKVLRDLCNGTPLSKWHYQFIHYDSPEQRGIDNALLYDSRHFMPLHSHIISVSDSAAGYFTRDILYVLGVTPGNDTIIVFVNHFPSKLGGALAERKRMDIACRLRQSMDSALSLHPTAAVIAVGDFNSTPEEDVFTQGLHLTNSAFTNLMAFLPQGEGSYKYQGVWSYIDQIIVSNNMLIASGPAVSTIVNDTIMNVPIGAAICPLQIKDHKANIFRPSFLLLPDKRYLGYKPKRTYQGWHYQNGFSDHLPVYIDVVRWR